MLLFVQVDLSKLNATSHESYVTDLVAHCLKNKIDGVVLRQNQFDEEARQVLKITNKIAAGKLLIISEG